MDEKHLERPERYLVTVAGEPVSMVRAADYDAAMAELERKNNALRYCELWFETHSPTANLINTGTGIHPALLVIRAAIESQQHAEVKP